MIRDTKRCVLKLFPDAVDEVDFEVGDNGRGSGPQITQWNSPNPQPTQEELEAAWLDVQIDLARVDIKRQLADTDKEFIRVIEDFIDADGDVAKLSQSALDKVAERKALRAQL